MLSKSLCHGIFQLPISIFQECFFYPSKQGIYFAKIRGFKVTDYIEGCSVGVAGCHGQTMAGRGLVSGSRRNEVPKGGWSAAEVCRGTCHPERQD